MRTVIINNPRLEETYITDVAVDYSSGTSVTVRNNNSFATNDLGVFGNPGEELTELKKINSISGTTLLNIASALNFAHNKGTIVSKSLWDFMYIEADYGSGFSVISQSPIQWDAKDNKTIYFDTNGTSTTSYRFRFYNSVTAVYSEYSPTLTGAGFTKYQMGYIIKEARRIAGDKEGRTLKIDECLRVLTQAKNEVRAHNARYWFWRVDGFHSNISIAATAGNNIYSFASISQYGILDYIEYQYISGGSNEKYLLFKKSNPEFLFFVRDGNRANKDYPRLYRLLPADSNSASGYFEIENKIKTTGVGTFYVSYFKEEADYDSVDDTTALYIPQLYIDYLAAAIYEEKGNETMRDVYLQKFTGPEARKKTMGMERLEGLALLDELNKQNMDSQAQPKQLWRFRGQRGVNRLFGDRSLQSLDQLRQDYFTVDDHR